MGESYDNLILWLSENFVSLIQSIERPGQFSGRFLLMITHPAEKSAGHKQRGFRRELRDHDEEGI